VVGAQAGIGGVDSWGSLPLMQYRLTLKKPIRFAFAILPFGVRNVNKLPSLVQKTRKVEERRRMEGHSSHSAVDPLASADDPGDGAGDLGHPLRNSPSVELSGVSSPMRGVSPPPKRSVSPPPKRSTSPAADMTESPATGGGQHQGAAFEPSSLARSLRLRFGPKVHAKIGRVRSFDGIRTPPLWMGSGLTSPIRGSSPDIDEGTELIGGGWATAASALSAPEDAQQD
jgi:hypothetical protein